MIIGESINQYKGYEEEHYDYLFKRKGGAPTKHQQKKIEKRAAKGKPPGRFMQKRLDRQAGITPTKKLIRGNFGLFNKNKNKNKETATQDAAAQTDIEQQTDVASMENATQSPEINSTTDNSATTDPAASTDSPVQDSGTEAPVENSYDEYDEPTSSTKSESKSQDKDSSKKGGIGVWVGWAFLGFTVVMIGYTMYRLDKMEEKLPGGQDGLNHYNY